VSRLLTVLHSSTWVAKKTDFRANGSVVGTGTATNRAGSAYLNLGTYINDAKNTANGKFVPTATISSVTGGNWLALGFATQNAPNTLRDFTNAALGSGNTQGYANMIHRVDGDIDQFRGLGSGTLATLTISHCHLRHCPPLRRHNREQSKNLEVYGANY